MSQQLIERTLSIALPDDAKGQKFDGPGHGLSHCMKAVDFIVEDGDQLIFIEIKDPDDLKHRPISENARQEAITKFKHKMSSPDWMNEITQKFRDTFIYLWAQDRLQGKTIDYYLLIAFDALDDALLGYLQDQLKRKLPVGKPASWTRSIVKHAGVLNLNMWNRKLSRYPVSRAVENPQEEIVN